MGHFGAEVGFDDLSLRDISAVVRRVESHVLFGGVHIGDRCACRIIRIGDYGQIRAVDLYNILFAPVDVGFADERRAGAGRRESKGYLAVLFVVSGIVRSSRVLGRRLGTGLKSQGEGANPCEQM